MRYMQVIKVFVLLLFLCKANITRAQNDTVNSKKPVAEESDFGDEVKIPSTTNTNTPGFDAAGEKPETGVAVSPSTVRFNAKPGTVQVKTVKLTNDTKRSFNFQLSLQDFMTDPSTGKEKVADKTFKYALSRYITVSPTFVELKPRESKVITITASIPDADSNAIAMWSQLIIDQMFERKPLEIPSPDKNTIGLGINAGMGFAVKILQNPPNVKTKNVEFTKLKFEPASEKLNTPAGIRMKVKNNGDGIGYCLYYVELTNLTTGRQTKVRVKQFSVLPGNEKELRFDIDKEFAKGKYSALTVLDFGDSETLQTAEIEFNLE